MVAGQRAAPRALDRLSLYFCLGPLEGATIDAVPADYMGTEVDWDLQPEGTTSRLWSPTRFAATRWNQHFGSANSEAALCDDLELQKVLAQAPYFGQKFTLRDGGIRMRARVAGN